MMKVKTARGSVLMETVIVIPIVALIFTFIWEFSLQARDQLTVAELGLSAVRLVGMRIGDTTPRSVRNSFPNADQYKDHRTWSYKIAPVDRGDLSRLGGVGSSSTLRIRDFASTRGGAPWSMLVGARAWYNCSGHPEDKTPLWMKIGVILSSADSRQALKPEIRATVARVMTYSLARTTASYDSKFPRHRTPQIAANYPNWWEANSTNRRYWNLPDHGAGAGGRNSWYGMGSADNTHYRDDISLGGWGTQTKLGYTRDRRLTFLDKAEP